MSRRPPANDDTEHGVLRRWSKRKARADQEPEAAGAPAPDGEPVTRGGAQTPRSGGGASDAGPEHAERLKSDEDMPDLDSINDASNVSDFFSPGVSEQLRNQALRRLFRTAKFNAIDPLDDYNENFRNFELLGDMVTSDMRHRMEMDEQRRKEAAEAADASADGETPAAEPVEESGREDRDIQEADRDAADTAAAGDSAAGDQDQSITDSDGSSRTST